MADRPPKPTDQPAARRFRIRRQSQKSKKPPWVDFPPGSRPDAWISMLHQRLTGRVIILFGKVEGVVQDVIWQMLNLDFDDGRAVTVRNDLEENLIILRNIANRRLSKEGQASFGALLNEIKALQEDRNTIAHAQWVTMQPMGIPTAMSIRKRSPNPELVASETFPAERMHELVNRIEACVIQLSSLLSELETSRGKSPQPPPAN